MSFVDMEITRRQFAARYVNVGRVMLADLAEIYGLEFDVAECWADAIDREADDQIAAVRPPFADGGIEGAVAARVAAPSPHSTGAAVTLTASQGGANLPGVARTAAPGPSHPHPAGSRRGPGASPPLFPGGAPGAFPQS